jgi:transcriptional regulator with XRE-family HTH domain
MTPTATTNQLRPVRDRLGLPRERVAAKLDPPISSKTLERWEAGETKPKLYRLQQLAVIYGVDIAELGTAA